MSFSPQEVEKIYNQLPCGYHSLDEKGIVVYINNIELQMLDYSREEVIGHHFSEFVTPESLPTFQDNFPLFKQRGWVNDLEFQMIRKDGTILPVAVSATAIRDEAGIFLRSHSILIDISNRKKIQFKYQVAQAALQESEEYFRVLFNLPVERSCAEVSIAENLQDTQRLHHLSTRLTTENDIQVLYDEILTTAIAIYAQQPQEIKVVLMDLVMPEMDGLTAMRALKIINPNVQLIATSGTATKEKVVTAESIGINSFLLKPYTAETLLSHLNQICSTEI